MKYQICGNCCAIAEIEHMTDHNLPQGGTITKCQSCDGNAYSSSKDGLSDKLDNIIYAIHVLWNDVHGQEEAKATEKPVAASKDTQETHEKEETDGRTDTPDTQAIDEAPVQPRANEKPIETQWTGEGDI